MSGKMQWSKDTDGMAHPDESMLLAYTRQQSLDGSWSAVQQHVNDCKHCLRRCNEYKQISTGITETLAYFQRTQLYPSLADDVFEFIHNPAAAQLARQQRQTARRQRKRASGVSRAKWQPVRMMRLVSVVSVAVLAILFMTVGGGLLLNGLAFQAMNNQGRGNTITIAGQSNKARPTGIVWTPQATGPTRVTEPATPTSTSTPISTPSATATATSVTPQPLFAICSSSPFRLLICGSNLVAGNTVTVTVDIPGRASVPQRETTVDAQGKIKVSWYINICDIAQVTVHLHDQKVPLNISQVLQLQTSNTKYCIIVNPTPAVTTNQFIP
ncbi:MAG: hypothetical protein NVS4B7_20100 [Ktedonobacteraceae bacterium]